MSEEVFETASQHEANKMLRVLKGERLKYTVRVTLPDDRVIEFQADEVPTIKFFEEDRCLWLHMGASDYSSRPMMKWIEGSILHLESNKV